jgi:hypothetical protein
MTRPTPSRDRRQTGEPGQGKLGEKRLTRACANGKKDSFLPQRVRLGPEGPVRQKQWRKGHEGLSAGRRGVFMAFLIHVIPDKKKDRDVIDERKSNRRLTA